jgi:hypothetical protein
LMSESFTDVSCGDPIRSGFASMSSIVVSMRVSDVTAAFRFGGILFSRRPQRLEKLLFFGLPCGGERKKVARLIRTAPALKVQKSKKRNRAAARARSSLDGLVFQASAWPHRFLFFLFFLLCLFFFFLFGRGAAA